MGTAVAERTAVEIVEELYARHERMIYARCVATLRSRTDAEDAVQTTFLQAFRAISRGVVPESEAAWLCTIADNVSRSSLRASFRRTRRIEAAEHAGRVAPNHDDSNGGTEDVRALRAALQELPERQRRVILLREWRGLSAREIAVELGISKSAADMLQHRARRALSRALQRTRAALDALGIASGVRAVLAGGTSSPVAAAVVSAALVATVPLVAAGSAGRDPASRAAPSAAVRASTPALPQGSDASASVVRQVPAVAPAAAFSPARSGARGGPASRAAAPQTPSAPAAPTAGGPVAQGDPKAPAGSEPPPGGPGSPLAPSLPPAEHVPPPVAPGRDPVVTVVEEIAGPVPAVPAAPLPVPSVPVPDVPVSQLPVPAVPVPVAPVQPPALPQPAVPTVPLP